MAYTRRSSSGNAVGTTLNGGVNNSDTSLTLTASTGWPDTSVGPFVATIDRVTSTNPNGTEEKILVAARTGTACSSITRGYDGTSAASHASGVSIEHTVGMVDIDEANLAVSKTIGKATAVGQLLVVDAANSFAAVQAKTSGAVLLGNGTTLTSTVPTGDVTINGSGVTAIGAGKVTAAMHNTTDFTAAGLALMDDANASAQRTTLGLGTAAVQNVGAFAQVANNLSDVTAATARTNLGLGTMAVVASPVPVANGGTASTTASAARTALGLAIGTDVQAWDADLDTLAAATMTLGAWSSYTPTLTQSGAVTKTVTYAKYAQIGKTVICNVSLAITGAGTGGNDITIGVPVTAAASGSRFQIGNGSCIIAGSPQQLELPVVLVSTTTVKYMASSGVPTYQGASSFANGDSLWFSIMYEAA